MRLYLHDIRIENFSTNAPTEEDEKPFPNASNIHLFCYTEEAEPVFVEIIDFRPSFFIDIRALTTTSAVAEWVARERTKQWARNAQLEIVERQRFVGFTDGAIFPFVRASFAGQVPLLVARKILRKRSDLSVYEDRFDPIIKFFHESGVKPCSYFDLTRLNERFEPIKRSSCTREFQASVKDISPCDAIGFAVPPILVAAYDIESTGLDPRKDRIFQVSVCFSRLGDPISHDEHAVDACKDGVVICVGPTESLDGTPVKIVPDEPSLLAEFRNLIVERQVGILVGYNNEQFDAQFLCMRAKTFNVECYFTMSPLKNYVCELVEKTLSSSALGNNELKQFIVPGIIEFDLFMQLRRSQHKLSSYKLNAVSQHFFGGAKDDVTYADILEASTTKDPVLLGVIAKYCLQDSWLCVRLLDKLKEVYDTGAMAKLCLVPHRWVLSRGQQIKVVSLILNHIHGRYVCNYAPPEHPEESEGYTGAVVIDAQKGFYGDVKHAVVTLDFASLYPSIIRWRNLCYTTHVDDPAYRDIPGVTYKDYEISPGVVETFASREGQSGVLCDIESFLGQARKATKSLMKTEKDPFRYSLLDATQKAQKVVANSVYGFTGTTHGMLPKKEIAAAVTCTGREIIVATKTYLEDKHDATIVYGDTDSVMCNFPVPEGIADDGILAYLFDVGAKAAREVTELFGYPVELEFENIYWPYLLVSKKRYAGRSLTSVSDPGKVSVKGLVSERRDNAPVVGRTARRCIEKLMAGDDPASVTSFVVDVLRRIEGGDIDVSELTICKELKKWKYVGLQPHAEMAQKTIRRSKDQRFFHAVSMPYSEGRLEVDWDSYTSLLRGVLTVVDGLHEPSQAYAALATSEYNSREDAKALRVSVNRQAVFKQMLENDIRGPDDVLDHCHEFRSLDAVEWAAPKLGDRIGYVVVEGPGDISSRVEDPRAITILGRKPDVVYYMTQMQSPLVDLLQHVDPDIEKIFVPFKRAAVNKQMGNRAITSFFRPVEGVRRDEPLSKRPKVIKM